ncbi:MAG: PHP domain-containing protein [Anaerosomatales bacterium]
MRLLADLHTHTLASGHAYSTATELAVAARRVGLELIAITDHGPACPGAPEQWYFWNLKVLPSIIDGVRILKGCEANPADSRSGVDLPDTILEQLDFVAVGFHPETGFDQRDRARNTEALLRVMANPNVDMITHPGNDHEFPLELATVVDEAAARGVVLELNDHTFAPTSCRASSNHREREFAEAAMAAGAPIAVNSDAHFANQVGHCEAALAVAEEIGLAEERIVNRTAESVLAHLLARRARPRLDHGGVWETGAGGVA